MWIISKIKGYLAILGIILVAIITAYAKGRKGGAAGAHREAQKATDKITKQFEKIDAQRPDFKVSVDSLRKRSLGP